MVTIKSHTSLEQSKKLAEILPIESADMYYWLAWSGGVSEEQRNTPKVGTPNKDAIKTYWCPCWSLASLLDVLPTIDDEFEPQLHRSLDKYFCTYEGEEDSSGLWRVANNPVDACYEMILKLHELKML